MAMADQPTIDDLMRAMPGTGDMMASVGRCFGECWHAAQAGNYDLAAYFVRRTRGLLRKLVIIRPKYTEQVEEFDRDQLEPLYQTLLARNLSDFSKAYDLAVERANFYHVDTGHPYIRWRTPQQAPDPALDLNTVDDQ